jgi:hypothetical protein
MAEPSIADQLRALRAGDDKGTGAIARGVTAGAEAKIRELLGVMHGKDPAEAAKAAGVLLELEMPAFPSVLGAVRTEPVPGLVWDIQLLGDIVFDARRRVVEKLDGLSEDKRDVPVGDGPAPSDEKPLPRRVCDEAYLILRRLLSSEPEEALYLNSRLFLKLSIEQKDQEIFFAKRERRFTRFDES